jgi:hypothetical protein
MRLSDPIKWLALTLVSLPLVSCTYKSNDPAESISDDKKRFLASESKCKHVGYIEVSDSLGNYAGKMNRPSKYYCRIDGICYLRIIGSKNGGIAKVPSAFCDRSDI